MSDGPPLEVLWPVERSGTVLGPDPPEDALAALYAYPCPGTSRGDLGAPPACGGATAPPWVRANMVATVDGAAWGADTRTGTINTPADFRVFVLLRSLADVVLAGVGTVRSERYDIPKVRPALAARRVAFGQTPAPALAVVTRSGRMPEDQGLFDGPRPALVLTCAAAGAARLARLRDLAGGDGVLIAGDDDVDLAAGLRLLAARGLPRVLCEGGPRLLGAVAAAGLLDDLCLTWSPMLAGGDAARVLAGPPLGLPLRLVHLLHADGSLLGRWLRA